MCSMRGAIKRVLMRVFPIWQPPQISQENTRCAELALKRVFGYARHMQSDKESFSNMAAPMILRENARCAFLQISLLLATIKMIPVLKTPFKESLAMRGTHGVLKRV